MTNKERILNTVEFKKTDRAPIAFYFGPWEETLDAWKKQGYQDGDYDKCGIDAGFEIVNVNLGYLPKFAFKVLEDRGDTAIIIDEMGVTQEILKGKSMIPRYISYPVKTPEDWLELKKRLDPNDPKRFPDNWNELVGYYNSTDKVVQLGSYPYGLFGTLRDMMGVENLCMNFYDQPELVQDMMDYLTDFWITIYQKVVKQVKVDAIHIWEDMSGKNGSLISPAMVREFMVPNYKKIATFAQAHGIKMIALDTDGDCDQLIPLFLESGINTIMPFEVIAGNDIHDYRAKYPNLVIMGGINKLEIAKGKEAIDKELERIRPMFKKGGYMPALDHLIHPDISWPDFQYFVKRLKEVAIEESES